MVRTLTLHTVFNTLNDSARSFNDPDDSSLATFDWANLITRIEDQSCVSRQSLDKVCGKILCLILMDFTSETDPAGSSPLEVTSILASKAGSLIKAIPLNLLCYSKDKIHHTVKLPAVLR